MKTQNTTEKASALAENAQQTIYGHHFTGATLRNGHPLPEINAWLKHDGPVEPCKSGLHCSEHPFDALTYAPGNLLHKVELRGDLLPHGNPVDKWVGRERKIVATIDATKLLFAFARSCALDVVHLWDAPAVVKNYLATGNPAIRAAAWDAAWAAAWDAARAAAGDAAWAAAWAAAGASARDSARAAARAAAGAAAGAAAWDAAWAAAWDAAGDAAGDAARDAARDAAGDAARAAAGAAAWVATGDAAWAATGDAAWAAAWAAAWDAQRANFAKIVDAAFAAMA